MQHVSLRDNQKLLHIVNNSAVGLTTLTEWFTTNERDPSGRHLKYIDFLSEYKWEANGKCWIRRSYKSINTIGRLAYVHPSCGERFFLCMLLNHQTGCQSFADVRTIDGVIYDTYRLACEKLGLLVDDNEWSLALDEAKAWATPTELRALFAHILLHCEVANPLKLWENHWRSMSDDITRNTEIFGGNVGDNVPDETLSSKSNTQVLVFVYGHGGTGKTFLWTTITSYIRSQGKIVLTVAASGIASLLLPNGRTAHSRLKIPIDLTDESNCNISKNSYLSELIIETELIIRDEAPMSDRKCFEALDRTLKDILNNGQQSFGGKSILLGGDFRQTLPVKKSYKITNNLFVITSVVLVAKI
ncbi:uncharacterized protein LOC143605165 [Bidens hawaiensis]|uniref:uncharacterized protein LOC143605165 n=1 Tax=Bidens hawaiensis TaxID=980011 RepID=UPI0040495AB5